MTNERLLEMAHTAIDNLFDDTSVEPERTAENLTELIADLEEKRSSLDL